MKILTQVPQNRTLLGTREIADIVSEDKVILKYGGPLIQYDLCPYKKGKFEHEQAYTGRVPCEMKVRGHVRSQSDASLSQ